MYDILPENIQNSDINPSLKDIEVRNLSFLKKHHILTQKVNSFSVWHSIRIIAKCAETRNDDKKLRNGELEQKSFVSLSHGPD